jgi:hypothetical protein
LHDLFGEPAIIERAKGESIQLVGMRLHGGAHTGIAAKAVVVFDEPQSSTHRRHLSLVTLGVRINRVER